MRVCCLNNYPLAKMWRLADSGSIPRQHVWGLDALAQAGFEIDIAPFHEPRERHALDIASRWTGHALGQLDQELHALSRRADLFYCADTRTMRGLALLRGARLLKQPLVTVLHHPIRASRLNAGVLRGTDSALCLSEAVRDSASQLGAGRASFVPWGPDLGSPLYAQPTDEMNGVVSAGKSNRDLRTLVLALERAAQPALVYDLHDQLSRAPEHVRVIRPGGEGADPDAPGAYLATRVIRDIAGASVVAICTPDADGLLGLTEVNDALAFGKPIVMTRLASFPFDLERVGCGILVEPGDAQGWTRAFERLADPGLRREMGARGRKFAEHEWNYARFSDALLGEMRRLSSAER